MIRSLSFGGADVAAKAVATCSLSWGLNFDRSAGSIQGAQCQGLNDLEDPVD